MLTFSTTTPQALLSDLKKAIDEKKITTWSYNKDGYFTHTPEQWRAKAWFLPKVITGTELRFGIVRPQNGTVNTEVYAVYHGRFIEMMLAHFDKKFTNGDATALATAEDRTQAA